MRFILEFISGKIKISNKKKAEIVEQLEAGGYPKSPTEKDYMYLLRMPMYNLTQEKIDELREKREDLESELSFMQSTTPSKMWITELDNIVKVENKPKVKIMKKKAPFKK